MAAKKKKNGPPAKRVDYEFADPRYIPWITQHEGPVWLCEVTDRHLGNIIGLLTKRLADIEKEVVECAVRAAEEAKGNRMKIYIGGYDPNLMVMDDGGEVDFSFAVRDELIRLKVGKEQILRVLHAAQDERLKRTMDPKTLTAMREEAEFRRVSDKQMQDILTDVTAYAKSELKGMKE